MKKIKNLNKDTVVFRFYSGDSKTGKVYSESITKWTGTKLVAEIEGVELRSIGEGENEHFVVTIDKIGITYGRAKVSEKVEQFYELAPKWKVEKKALIDDVIAKTVALYEKE